MLNNWHYHPEIELVLFKKTAGIRIIGSNVGNFQDNDVLMIGKNLPHTFLHEDKYIEKQHENGYSSYALVIKFDERFMGKDFLYLPELKDIQDLFYSAQQGIILTEAGKKKVIPLMEKMVRHSPIDRIITLLKILRIMAAKNAFRLLIKERFLNPFDKEEGRLQQILEYTADHFDQNIAIDQIAAMANLTKESFCRYFKKETGKTYIEFLTEFRIRHACHILLENKKNIKEIGYACGFESLSNFHYQFKKIMKQSPLEYRHQRLPKLNSTAV
jgi:AraC-like DNA-binding protein